MAGPELPARHRGRPTLLTPELQQQICELTRAGATAEVAATVNGITAATFYGWMLKGREGDDKYVDFFEAVTEARMRARLGAELKVRADSPEFWLKNSPTARTAGQIPGWERAETQVNVQVNNQINVGEQYEAVMARLDAIAIRSLKSGEAGAPSQG